MPIVVWGAKTSVLNRNSIHAITYQKHANTYQYIPQYMPDTWQLEYLISSAHGFSPSIQVLACILVCIGMYCASIWHVLCNYPCHWARVRQSGLFLAELSPIKQLQQSHSWLKGFKHFKIEFESTTQNHLNGGQWSWSRCLGISYSQTTSR